MIEEADLPAWPPFQQRLPATGQWVSVSVPGPAAFAVIASSSSNSFGDAAILFAAGAQPPTDDTLATVATGFGQGILSRGGLWWFKTLSTAIATTVLISPRSLGDANPNGRSCDGVLGSPVGAMMLFHAGPSDRLLIPANPRRQGLIIDLPPNLGITDAGEFFTQTAVASCLVGFGFLPSDVPPTGTVAVGTAYPSGFTNQSGFFLSPGDQAGILGPHPTYRSFGPEVWKGSIGILAKNWNGVLVGPTDVVAIFIQEFV